MNIEKEFINWMEGLIEDDPIPFEIKSLVFYLNSHLEIGFSGSEKEEVRLIEEFFYYPLEAQFFYCPKLYNDFYAKKDLEFCLKRLKKLVKQLKSNENFKSYHIFYGKLNCIAKKI